MKGENKMYQLTDYLDSIAANPLFMGRNLLINAGFWVNQRGYTSGTVTASANQFTLDRWFIPTSGQSLSFTDYEGTRTITAPASGICQVIEGEHIPSGAYTLSWQGTATGYVNDIAFTNGSSMSITGGANITVKFEGGTVSNPQFEKGSTATSFENRLYSLEELLCKRYYLKVQSENSYLYSLLAVGIADTSTTVKALLPCTISMRTTPSLNVSGNWYIQGTGSTFGTYSNISVSSISIADKSPIGFKLSVGAASLILGQYYQLFAYNNSGIPYIEFNAELTS